MRKLTKKQISNYNKVLQLLDDVGMCLNEAVEYRNELQFQEGNRLIIDFKGSFDDATMFEKLDRCMKMSHELGFESPRSSYQDHHLHWHLILPVWERFRKLDLNKFNEFDLDLVGIIVARDSISLSLNTILKNGPQDMFKFLVNGIKHWNNLQTKNKTTDERN